MDKPVTGGESPRQHSRRAILSAGMACGLPAVAGAAQATPATQEAGIPRSTLGRTGASITRLGMGGSLTDYAPRLLEFAFRSGIRYYDMGEFYFGHKAEGILGEWIRKSDRRKDVFVVTKAHTTDPEGVRKRVDQALERMGIDAIDLFFIHGLSDPAVPLDRDGTWRKLKERLIRENKIRFMGFSTHAEMPQRIACLNNAAKGGWVDALMVACDPLLVRSRPDLNKAIDACSTARIGLIAMKTGRGLGKFTEQPDGARKAFEKLGMGPHVTMLAGIWSDGRFAAVCSEMPNFQTIEENTTAARSFKKPFDERQWNLLEDAARSLSRATCPGCDGSCRLAANARTDFCSITRYLAYYRESGNRALARELYGQLSADHRDWRNADLKAASRACRASVDFESLLPLADRLLGDPDDPQEG